MAKTTTLRERGSLQPLYPKTISSQVILPDGHNLDHELSKQSNVLAVSTENRIEEIEPGIITDALRKVPQVLTPEEQEQVKANIGVSKMELFCDLFTEACIVYGRNGGIKQQCGYARITDGLFDCMLNGLSLTLSEALKIYSAGRIRTPNASRAYYAAKIRTNLPPSVGAAGGVHPANLSAYELYYGPWMEVLNLVPTGEDTKYTLSSGSTQIFHEASLLHTILGPVSLFNMPSGAAPFSGAPKLANVQLQQVSKNLSLSNLAFLSLDSVSYLVHNASNTTSITLTVHPDVYAKLTDEANTQWHQVLIDAAEKNINFATV